ncbi:MAG TPA: tripartite tricarboxylate transporter substrate binding protein [Burkholderiaceae bacterium]|nr:tripartite tricarboxylate transporter substrate binding protein [Burkholderiaceae bacterium]
MRRDLLRALAIGLGLSLTFIAAPARAFPDKPVRIINPFAPGGATDIIARHMAQKLTEAWGQSVIVENRPGASGAIGVQAVARSPADGYTLLIATQTTHAANPALYAKLPYDAVKDFAPLTLAGSTPLALVVHPSVPANSVGELLEHARKQPGKLLYASGGNGTSQHLTAELMKSISGTFLVHIPYKGAGPAMTDLLGGQVHLMFDNLPTALPHVRAGKLRALAVSTSTRSPMAPELPTMAESGLAGFDLATWFAFFAPAGTPAAIIDKIATDMRRALSAPDTKERLTTIGVEIRGSTPEELGSFVRSELDKWARIVKISGAKLD